MRILRVGIGRAREELEALLRERVVEVSGGSRASRLDAARVYLGTEAVLHQVASARVVAFLEFDQELLAPRYRASEQALALLARAARMVGPRDSGGRVVVQTRIPDHEVLRAAQQSDPGIVMDAELERRAVTGFPPAVSVAVIGGEAAPAYMDRLGSPAGVSFRQADDSWLAVADDRRVLLDALAGVDRPTGRLRLQIDPMRF